MRYARSFRSKVKPNAFDFSEPVFELRTRDHDDFGFLGH